MKFETRIFTQTQATLPLERPQGCGERVMFSLRSVLFELGDLFACTQACLDFCVEKLKFMHEYYNF